MSGLALAKQDDLHQRRKNDDQEHDDFNEGEPTKEKDHKEMKTGDRDEDHRYESGDEDHRQGNSPARLLPLWRSLEADKIKKGLAPGIHYFGQGQGHENHGDQKDDEKYRKVTIDCEPSFPLAQSCDRNPTANNAHCGRQDHVLREFRPKTQ